VKIFGGMKVAQLPVFGRLVETDWSSLFEVPQAIAPEHIRSCSVPVSAFYQSFANDTLKGLLHQISAFWPVGICKSSTTESLSVFLILPMLSVRNPDRDKMFFSGHPIFKCMLHHLPTSAEELAEVSMSTWKC
jgi:hypothetical protein